MEACCGLRRLRGGESESKRNSRRPSDQQQHQQQQHQHQHQQQNSAVMASIGHDYFAKLGSVLSSSELESTASDILGNLFNCHSFCLHFNEASPLARWGRQSGSAASTFQCAGYAESLACAGSFALVDAAAVRQSDEATRLFGGLPPVGCAQGLAIPISDQGVAHCLVTVYPADEVSERHKMSLESLRRQLDATCTRLVRLASLGFNGSSGRDAPCQTAAAAAVTATDSARQPVQSDCHPILALCGELYDQDSEHLQLKVIKYLKNRIDCETGFLLLVSQDRAHVFCQVVGDTILADQIHIGAHMNFFETIIQSSKHYYLGDVPQEQLSDISSVLGDSVSICSLLCVPVASHGASQVVAIACMVNKTSASNFSESDVAVIQECFRYTSTVLTSTIAFQTERMLKNQTQALLQVAQNIFRKLDDLTVLLREIMAEARNLTQAERCSVFLLDRETNELVAKVFDGLPTASNEKEVVQRKILLSDGTEIEQPVEIRIPATHGVAGYVATKGELLNIKDAYSHPLFYSKVDENTGFRTRNILCFPIQDELGNIVGVAQLCNKIKAAHFSTFDEDLARAFSVYCCIAIIHSLMYKKVQAAQARHQLATELMTYHMHVPERGVHDLATAPARQLEKFCPNFDQFVSVPRHIVEEDSCAAVMQMFDDLNLTKTWRIRRTTLARFVLLARKGYRDPPYHNWSHAFSVAHFTYLCLKNLRLASCLTPLEFFSFLVASLCHDIDHRGTNNSFENSSGSALSGLYSSEGSVLERHHFSQTVCILNREGCNVFENLSEKEYSAVLDIIRDIILATDLAHHLKIKSEIDAVAESGPDWSCQQHRYLMLCLLMTASDLSDQTKVWKNTRQVAKLIYQEFFSLGDKEKSLGKQPAEGMDRDKADIPQLQVNFLNIIAAPVYRAMVKVWPAECSVLTQQIERNVSNWRIIGQKLSSGEAQRCDATIFEAKLVPDDD